MNFEIQKRALSSVIRDDLDALIVLWPSQQGAVVTDKDAISSLVRAASAHGDFEYKPGAVLSLYVHPGIKSRHLVVVCVADGSTAHVRSAVLAAWNALKSARVKRMGLHAVADMTTQLLQVAVSTLADASYSYTSTLSKPKPRTDRKSVV